MHADLLAGGKQDLKDAPSGIGVFDRSTVVVTSSPGLKLRILQPLSIMSARVLVSATQCTTLPMSSFTSNFSQQWRLCRLAQPRERGKG